MDLYKEFFLKFMEPLFGGLYTIVKGIGEGILKIFNLLEYVKIINDYFDKMGSFGVFIVVVSVVCLLILLFIITFLIYRAIKSFLKYRRNLKKQENLIEEIEDLTEEVTKLKAENEKFYNMADPEKGGVVYDEEGNIVNELQSGESRFFKLTKVDEEMEGYEEEPYTLNIGLEEFCERFRNYAASKLKLYYPIETIRLFVSAFASNRLIILQGISGTGKTSLAYAFGSFIQNDTIIASVQPSWRDNTELFGYFNEFTKRFNETEVLRKMYEASYRKSVYLTLLDEMNISRVEYYFAEMLSILELPLPDEWQVELVPNSWENDPKKIVDGKFKIPENMWYVGTINNDDSTFMVTDKVYDRAFPINIDTKCEPFDAPEAEPVRLSYEYLEQLFKDAAGKYSLSQETMDKINEMDKYIISHFRIAFGNRIVKQIQDFTPVFMACGGDELQAVDYLIAHKIFRKFEQLNLTYIRNEIDGFIEFMNNLFGAENMPECQEFLQRLKKSL